MSGKDHDRLISFVRHVLGCACSEELFQHIETTPGYELEPGAPLFKEVLIGGRLLIFFVDADALKHPSKLVPVFAAHGRARRDAAGLNRFRLVFLGSEAADKKVLDAAFERTASGDERMHFHYVGWELSPFGRSQASEI